MTLEGNSLSVVIARQSRGNLGSTGYCFCNSSHRSEWRLWENVSV